MILLMDVRSVHHPNLKHLQPVRLVTRCTHGHVDFFEEREWGEHVHEAEAAPAARGLGERGGQHHHHRGDILEEEPPQVAPERIHRAKTLADRAELVRVAGQANCVAMGVEWERELALRGGWHAFTGTVGGGGIAGEVCGDVEAVMVVL